MGENSTFHPFFGLAWVLSVMLAAPHIGGKGALESIALFNKINSVFDKYTTSWNSLDKTSASKVFNDEVLLEIDKIYDYVVKYPVDWKIDTMETILKRLEKDIRTNFPYLDDKAVGILKNYFTYQWK